ncbi:uncharacterized protein CIMG_08861 [Coccidioides immitis RS]|uniref:Major facilitator superfamily (MFS) profile domain-containing protein n=1 Tax=Coccidioides immitis (strain RS) TaxID=246410 RepID=J3K6D2_COCIM|nr:uncharacterized protein CIMG_08861 [Coccidioides immitis RS]EAS30115.3 hypothetical protein CIMG_08861 [Coccidioides immitis RS]
MTQADGEITPASSLSGIQLQLFMLGTFRATEAIAWTSIFPYVYFMIQSFDEVDHADIPLYSGMLISIFTFCEFLSGMVWAKISDRIGRKPTLLIGALCGIITAISFGLSKSMVAITLSRALGGLTNPNVGVVQTCVGELVERKEQQAKAFSVVPFLRSLGTLLGPPLGGLLADPVKLYPNVFQEKSIWKSFPYLLPNLLVGVLSFSGMVLGLLLLQETHPQLVNKPDIGIRTYLAFKYLFTGNFRKHNCARYSRLDHAEEDGIELRMETEAEPEQEAIQAPCAITTSYKTKPTEKPVSKAFTLQVILQVISVFILAFHKVSSDIITPIFLAIPAKPTKPADNLVERNIFQFTDVFGFSSQKIGFILLTQAGVAIIAQSTLIPWIVGRFGALKCYRMILCIFPVAYLFTPFLVKLKSPFSIIALLFDLWVKVLLSSTGYICSAIFFLARINGVAASFGCLARSIGPLISGRLFKWGIQEGYIGIAFWTLSTVAFIGALESFFLLDHA